jgi:hypothetical protein
MNNSKMKMLKCAALGTSLWGSFLGVITPLEVAASSGQRGESSTQEKWPLQGDLRISSRWLCLCAGNNAPDEFSRNIIQQINDLLDDAKRREAAGMKSYDTLATIWQNFRQNDAEKQKIQNEAIAEQATIQKKLKNEMEKLALPQNKDKVPNKKALMTIADLIITWQLKEHIVNEMEAMMRCQRQKYNAEENPQRDLTEQLRDEVFRLQIGAAPREEVARLQIEAAQRRSVQRQAEKAQRAEEAQRRSVQLQAEEAQ